MGQNRRLAIPGRPPNTKMLNKTFKKNLKMHRGKKVRKTLDSLVVFNPLSFSFNRPEWGVGEKAEVLSKMRSWIKDLQNESRT